MKPRSTNLLAFAVAALFGFSILCVTIAAPTRALASATGCAPTAGFTPMPDCEHPTYLCAFDLAGKSLARGATISARSSDSLDSGLHILVPIPGASTISPPGFRERRNTALNPPGKVSVRLLNSILNL
jgi:hypothetical protein